MPYAHELNLPTLDIQSPDLAADPNRYLTQARAVHPWLAKCYFGYVVHGYEAMRDLLYLDQDMAASNSDIVDLMGGRGTRWANFMDEMMINKTGAEHARLRNSVAEAFTPRAINRLRPLMRETVTRLLDEWAPKGAFDFAEFASNFPIVIMFAIVGASPALLPGIRDAFEVQGMSMSINPDLLPKALAAYDAEYNFVDRLFNERMQQGSSPESGELLDLMIAAQRAGQLSEVEMRDLLIFLTAAGYDTSKNMLTLILHLMINHPEDWKRCGEDRDFCNKVVEESFRMHSPANPYRTVTKEFTYKDVTFPPGAMILFTNSMSGHDPSMFPNDASFDPERKQTNRHLGFGRGPHICIGMHLARAQIEEGVHLIAQRIRNPRLAGEVTWRPFPAVWGLRTLPITFDPGTARQNSDAMVGDA